MGGPNPMNITGPGGLYGGYWQANSQNSSGALRLTGCTITGAYQQAVAQQRAAALQAAVAQQQALGAGGGFGTLGGAPLVRLNEPDWDIEDGGIDVCEVIAWRCWRIEHGWLYSIVEQGVEWAPGAVIEAHKIGPVLGEGIHAFKTRKQAVDYVKEVAHPHVVGTVALWGEVYEFEGGWHGQYARVNSLDVYLGDWERRTVIDKGGWFRRPVYRDNPHPLDQLRETYGMTRSNSIG